MVLRLNSRIQEKNGLPQSSALGKHFELLLGFGKIDMAELWPFKIWTSAISHVISPYGISPRD